ncbi:MAG TPA: hypothetical protein VFL29_04275 [Candidatus Dormibacteraeota bacterium]|nr:hypothetical protein [Candidatus Dormibacteraeota bacterium]
MNAKHARLLALAAVAYIVAAWSVAPGFYDGFQPPQPYNFVCPPPQAGANGQPTSGHLNIKIINGSSDPNTVFTDDGQVVIGFLPGAFDVTGKTSVNVTITPVTPCPKPSGLRFVTNTYLITADAPLVKSSNLEFRYSNLEPDPSYIYRAKTLDGPWTKINVQQQAQIYTISGSTDQLGYFSAGFPANAISTNPSSNQNILPIVVAVLIGAVLLAGVPMAVLRRRSARADDDDDDE